MPKTMISLIGEQPIPNILPVKAERPEEVILAYTERTRTLSQRLEKILANTASVKRIEIPAYDIPQIAARFRGIIVTRRERTHGLVFNLTGGTKPMVLGLHLVATESKIPFVYFQTEGMQSKLYKYRFDGVDIRLVSEEVIDETITISEYLRAHLDDFQETGFSQTPGGAFEKAVCETLSPCVDEILAGIKKGALDIDLVVRRANQIAIVEVKSGDKARGKRGIDQLNTAASREFLGIYTRKILAIDTKWDDTRSNLQELAAAHGITLIEFPSYSKNKSISRDERQNAINKLDKILGKIR